MGEIFRKVASINVIVTRNNDGSLRSATSAQLSNRGCDLENEKYLTNSPGIVPSLDVCTQLCEESSECMSVTLYASKWCSHFSTACSRPVSVSGATLVRFHPKSYTASWTLAANFGAKCDYKNGELYMPKSSKIRGSLSECLDSCEAASGCRSAVFYYNSKFCSHFSTPCTARKEKLDADVYTLPRRFYTTPTVPPSTPDGLSIGIA